ncbi:uncharacterized protein LOC131942892 [Physella acuta]|uniref:uncharacterized protein LOC131942892 n=1 Tax=Physella acuta TaxID=109671 RepID=UPI0027DAD890|nr:uncharacterized protein LOC131942892 [Physella acuta]
MRKLLVLLLSTMLLTVVMAASANSSKNVVTCGHLRFSDRWSRFLDEILYNITTPVFSRVLEPLAMSSPLLNGATTNDLIDLIESVLNKKIIPVNKFTEIANNAIDKLVAGLTASLDKSLNELIGFIKKLSVEAITKAMNTTLKAAQSVTKDVGEKAKEAQKNIEESFEKYKPFG